MIKLSLYLSLLAVIAFFTVKIDRENKKLDNLEKQLYDARIENDNLRYNLDMCKVLYMGKVPFKV